MGNFDGVDIHVDVVHAAGIQRGQQVLGRGQQHALLHQAGGVADARHVASVRFDFKVVEVHAAEDDARIGWRGHQTHAAGNRGVQPYSVSFNLAHNGGLVRHAGITARQQPFGPATSGIVCRHLGCVTGNPAAELL